MLVTFHTFQYKAHKSGQHSMGTKQSIFSVKTNRVGVLGLFRAMNPFANVVKHKDSSSETCVFMHKIMINLLMLTFLESRGQKLLRHLHLLLNEKS
jgi:hypothetical protein